VDNHFVGLGHPAEGRVHLPTTGRQSLTLTPTWRSPRGKHLGWNTRSIFHLSWQWLSSLWPAPGINIRQLRHPEAS